MIRAHCDAPDCTATTDVVYFDSEYGLELPDGWQVDGEDSYCPSHAMRRLPLHGPITEDEDTRRLNAERAMYGYVRREVEAYLNKPWRIPVYAGGPDGRPVIPRA